MQLIQKSVEETTKEINDLHEMINRISWTKLTKETFVFELETCIKKLKIIKDLLKNLNKELTFILEPSVPKLDDLIVELNRELIVLESNISLEKHKKFRNSLLNELEKPEVPELYLTIQQKIISLILKCRYSIERINSFENARNMPFVKKGATARDLIEILQKKEDEVESLKQKNISLRKKSFFGEKENLTIDLEEELNSTDKQLEINLSKINDALKTHYAQIEYVVGSYNNLQKSVQKIEILHENYTKKSIELIKQLKKEKDYANQVALEIEQETIMIRSEYNKRLLNIEDEKNKIKEDLNKKNFEENKSRLKIIEENKITIDNLSKLIKSQEETISKLKEKLPIQNQ
ncbi:MAG: hypothetical protein PHQ98_02070 [Candidatus ainarchaeum sp.]|nr:hypothetical protein [Candidatus ainarchaeum sp.]